MSEAAGEGRAELGFACVGITADRYAASPSVTLRMRATERTGERVHAVALRCQVRVEPLRRSYSDPEAAKVVDLFGGRSRWGQTMQALQLAFLTQLLPSFEDVCDFDLVLPLSYDVDVAAHKYLAGLEDGTVPLLLLFSGTVFTGRPGSISVQPVPWHTEAEARLPVAVWREAMDAHFPGQAWVRLDRPTYDRLVTRRGALGLTSWDEVVEDLLRWAEP